VDNWPGKCTRHGFAAWSTRLMGRSEREGKKKEGRKRQFLLLATQVRSLEQPSSMNTCTWEQRQVAEQRGPRLLSCCRKGETKLR